MLLQVYCYQTALPLHPLFPGLLEVVGWHASSAHESVVVVF